MSSQSAIHNVEAEMEGKDVKKLYITKEANFKSKLKPMKSYFKLGKCQKLVPRNFWNTRKGKTSGLLVCTTSFNKLHNIYVHNATHVVDWNVIHM